MNILFITGTDSNDKIAQKKTRSRLAGLQAQIARVCTTVLVTGKIRTSSGSYLIHDDYSALTKLQYMKY